MALHAMVCWCEGCGFTARLPRGLEAEGDFDAEEQACPYCPPGWDGEPALLSVGPDFPDHIIEEEIGLEWKEVRA